MAFLLAASYCAGFLLKEPTFLVALPGPGTENRAGTVSARCASSAFHAQCKVARNRSARDSAPCPPSPENRFLENSRSAVGNKYQLLVRHVASGGETEIPGVWTERNRAKNRSPVKRYTKWRLQDRTTGPDFFLPNASVWGSSSIAPEGAK